MLAQALELWRGPPLAEVAFEDFARGEIRRLEELAVVALETRIDADLRLGRHAELVPELEGLLAEQPTRERIAGELMTALYRSGRQTKRSRSTSAPARTSPNSSGSNPGLRSDGCRNRFSSKSDRCKRTR